MTENTDKYIVMEMDSMIVHGPMLLNAAEKEKKRLLENSRDIIVTLPW